MHAGYFEGILQLRNTHMQVVEYVEKHYFNYISKRKEVRNGIDYYFISNKKLRKVGRKLESHFGGILKESPKLFSRDRMTQRAIYRLNVLFRLFDFKKKDVIKVDNKVIYVTSIKKKKVFGINIKTNNKTSFILRRQRYEIIPVIDTRVIRTNPHIEVLDEDYQNTKIQNKKTVKINQKVKVVYSDGYWLI